MISVVIVVTVVFFLLYFFTAAVYFSMLDIELKRIPLSFALFLYNGMILIKTID